MSTDSIISNTAVNISIHKTKSWIILFIAVGFSQRIKLNGLIGFSQIVNYILAKAKYLLYLNPLAKANGNELLFVEIYYTHLWRLNNNILDKIIIKDSYSKIHIRRT